MGVIFDPILGKIRSDTGTQGPQGADGAQGDQGSQGPQGLAGGSMSWQGAWVTATSYAVDDAVENDGSSYICIQAHTSDAASEPGVGGSWSSYWNLMAQKGAQGDQGPQGTQGVTGAQGDQGDQGDTGSTGPQGTQGYQGDTGPQGVQGATGDTGPQGATGAQGSTGAQGPQGTQGNQGDTGATGAQGDQGDQGTQGNQGTQGVQGAVGAQGAQGTQGPQGVAGSSADTGAIQIWPTDTPPTGWLLCDGSAVSRTTYSDLYALIGTTYGAGDGSTTFNLPNMKGKVVAGKDSGQTEFDALAETGGAKTHTLTTAELPAHAHSTPGLTGWPAVGSGAGWNGWAGGQNPFVTERTATNNAGSGTAHNNMQPYIVLNFIIKT